MQRGVEFYIPLLVVVGGLICLLSVFYFAESFSYSIGYETGVIGAINTYNVTNATNSVLVGLEAMIGTFRLGSHIVYAMLFLPIIMLGIGAFWMFGSMRSRSMQAILVVMGIVFLLLATLLVQDFRFSGPLLMVFAAYIGALLVLGAGGYTLYIDYTKTTAPRSRAVRSLEIDPTKPYSNMDLIAKRLFGSLSGNVKILDMHFDSKAVQNLSALMSRSSTKFSRILVLTSKDRIGDRFRRDYSDFRAELANSNIAFEIRIMNEEDIAAQHERLILDGSKAYKIPPMNIINRKSEHIVSVNHKQAFEHFETIWNRAAKLENFGKGNSGKRA